MKRSANMTSLRKVLTGSNGQRRKFISIEIISETSVHTVLVVFRPPVSTSHWIFQLALRSGMMVHRELKRRVFDLHTVLSVMLD